MIRLFINKLHIFLFLFPLVLTFGKDSSLSLTERLAELKARSNVHEGQIAKLLSEPPINRTNFALPASETEAPIIIQPPRPDPAFIPVPNYSSEVKEVKVQPEVIIVEVTENDQNNSTQDNAELDQAYAKLYEPDVPSRLVGYYFGPLLGLVFPQDGAIRERSPLSPLSKKEYEADSGYLLGLQVGKDFGGIRVEAEYTYHSFDASTQTTSLSASIHNFFSRLILEKELGERFDLRAGIGMGMGIVGLEGTADYGGTGFAYDFVFGGSYRLAENWSIQADYRYYLTAANDHYDHIKSHLWVLSASLDL